MKAQAEKLVELEYDEMITLAIIESDIDLTTVFREVTPLSFNILRTIIKQGGLNEDTKEIMRGIFESIILTKIEYIHRYQRYSDSGLPITEEAIVPVIVPVEEIVIPTEPLIDIIKKEKKEKEFPTTPRWYGKEKIKADIEAQGGKPKPAQRAALAINDLKNMYSNLNARVIKDMLSDKQILSDEDYRTITASITMLNNKLETILKKK